jgi:hypothetical protein
MHRRVSNGRVGNLGNLDRALAERIRGQTMDVIVVDRKHPGLSVLVPLVVDQIRADICGDLNVPFPTTTVQAADILFVGVPLSTHFHAGQWIVFDKHWRTLRSNDISGFAIVKDQPNYLHVTLLCSARRVGAKLLATIEAETLARRRQAIVLDSVDSAVGFYRHQGYIHANLPPNCEEKSEHYRLSSMWQSLTKRYGRRPLDNNDAFRQWDRLLRDLKLCNLPGPLYPMIKRL